ncbi:unnamed protein product [Dovyalis caffra]|uniref:Glutaminyl-peptide cyclotransferase n=1 Tax=Dovyalis caffra TaxID=77055 RepID=A0AAV1RPV5_9ROSI|nr:unnamed protein product [Dovyalis caffra]
MSSSSFTRLSYKKVSVFVSVVMIFGVIFLLGISSNIWSGVASVPKLYAVQVINEFHHDPSAFTQIGVVFLLGISLNIWISFASVDHSPKIYATRVLNEFPHDPKAFTQGLLYAGNGMLYESTGLYGKSSVRRVALHTGKVEALQEMDDSYFGEGLTLFEQRNLGDVSLAFHLGITKPHIGEFTHGMDDGWGLATDGKVIFGSDGSSALYQLDPRTFKVIKKQIVSYNGHEVHYLNELEFVNDEVWANVWQTDCIARISPNDGSMLGWILLPNLRKGLIAAGYNGIDVLNGIAWDGNDNRVFVTGKLWPKLFEIKLHPIKKHIDNGVIEQLCIPRRL